ncbi:hypothetical protein GCM10020220_019720 [Nonomuraea rubra]
MEPPFVTMPDEIRAAGAEGGARTARARSGRPAGGRVEPTLSRVKAHARRAFRLATALAQTLAQRAPSCLQCGQRKVDFPDI